MKKLMFSVAALVVSTGAALATPPASCRDKFVGTWKYFGGTTTVFPDGTAKPNYAPMQTWTCQGNQYIFRNPNGQTWTATLSEDGNKLVGPNVATRVSPKSKGESKPKLIKGSRIPGFENCASFKLSDKDYQKQAKFFDQYPPHQWHVLVTAASNCKVPIVFNACFTFHTLPLPYQLGGGEHLLGRKNVLNVAYYSSGVARDGSYSYAIRFCEFGKGPCKVSCP